MQEIPDIQFRNTDRSKYGFEIFSINYLYNKKLESDNYISDYRKLKFFMIIFVEEGEDYHYIDFEKQPIKKGDIVFVAKEQINAFSREQTAKGTIIIFTEEFISKNLSSQDIYAYMRLFNYQFNSPSISINKEQREEIYNIFYLIKKEYDSENEYLKEDLMRNSLRILLLKCERELNRKSPLPKSLHFDKFIQFQKLISERYMQTHNATDFANMMNISYKHLNELSKEFTNKTAKTLIDEHLVLEIKRQLAIKNLSIKETAYSTGFDEITNFTKFIKKKTGFTPSEFRKQL
jgi:AraC-like DNA-binding protein